MVAAVHCFSLMDALLKTQSTQYPEMQVAALRGWSDLPLVALYMLWHREADGPTKVRWPLPAARRAQRGHAVAVQLCAQGAGPGQGLHAVLYRAVADHGAFHRVAGPAKAVAARLAAHGATPRDGRCHGV